MPPKTTVWELDAHTRGKHLVLRNYLNAWLPIMGMGKYNGRILVVDGFAGPGQYKGGEDGSPIIALKALIEHRAKHQIAAEVVFMFIEKDAERAAYLQTLLHKLWPSLPSNCKVRIHKGIFDQTMTQVLSQLDAQTKQLAPSFVMIDPFGVSETPMGVVERILKNPKSEVYISYMYEFINRFSESPEFEHHLDNLFGTPDWRAGNNIADAQDRKQFFYDLYERQLRKAGARHVVHFELYEGNRLVYTIFFGTHSSKGCDVMKQAIWKVAPFGDFAFRGAKAGQLSFDLKNADFEPLKRALQDKFRSRGWINIEQVHDFVESDQTDFHTGQYKTGVLVPLEKAGQIEVDPSTRKMKNTYPARTRLRFL